ncbi:uncharacterized protein LOC126367268 [Pectinophora gossypiella]|uniref:uncharacterized protein LOC126367268 n=1 Tax=Pectinophora gossypiella TaxID=13191 RepID=UPI00214EA101|nr:uncharacterized protein LOC126367268 [Pectinophora gossypiella]
MIDSLSPNTLKQYDCYLKEWYKFCENQNVDYLDASIPNILFFFTKLYNSGYNYGSLNCCKSALSTILGKNISSDDRIARFMKGVFRCRPPKPKYQFTWDIDIVLDYLAHMYPNDDLSLELLSKKLVTLLALITAQRAQTLSKIQVNNILYNSNCITIKISEATKTSRPNSYNPLLKLPYFNEKPAICPARALCCYKNKTESIRKTDCNYFFISYRKPHSRVTNQTLSHWIKDMLHRSGIDTTIFGSHSTRHASTSKAKLAGVSLDVIRRTAGWSVSSSVFARFYNKDIVAYQDSFAHSILDS